MVTLRCAGGYFVAFIYSLEMMWAEERFSRLYWVSQISLVGNAFSIPYAICNTVKRTPVYNVVFVGTKNVEVIQLTTFVFVSLAHIWQLCLEKLQP